MVCDDCRNFPKNDSIGWVIRDQVLRSSGSIGANIAEGFARQTKKEFIQFLNIARGSLAETEVWITRMLREKFITEDRSKIYQEKLTIIAKMMNALIKSLYTSQSKTNSPNNQLTK